MVKLRTMAPDQAARDEALETHGSYIVQAPAGSGKTELLTHRFLKLLAQIDEPEEILAITFTRAATAEMRSRILQQLEAAKDNPIAGTNDDAMLVAARAALAHSTARGWRLLEQPQRLDIQTIDSLCMRIAHEQPLLARMGGHLQPQEDGRPLYDMAARRTLANLGTRNEKLNSALLHLLQLRDNNLPDCERLIAGMLAQRDQWLHAFPLIEELSNDDWDAIRLRLEAPFRQSIRRALNNAHRLLMTEPFTADQLMQLAHYSCSNPSETDIGLLATLRTIPEPAEALVQHWKCLCNFLLKKKTNEWQTRFTKAEGFPPASQGKTSEERHKKDSMKALIERLSHIPGLLPALGEIRNLPPARYDEDQWRTLRDVFTILRYAVAELRVLFAEQNSADFVELSIAALTVLEQEHPTERMLAVSERIRHLLVDEFQDTSRRQHKLVQMLIRAWNRGDGRTCFLVGDPMQSIYMFRQAEVELFEQVRVHGIVSAEQQHDCKPLRLSANFRSHAGLTEPLNKHFERIFSGAQAAGSAAVSFSRSEAVTTALRGRSVCLHPQFLRGVSRGWPEKDDRLAAQHGEADEVLDIIQKQAIRIAQADANPKDSYTVAVLARARQHLTLIAQKLRERDIPFRSVELETLAELQEIRDLLSLTRALLHPMDRIAWLSVLRAPWCGLTLRDLHILSGEDDPQFALAPIQQLIEKRLVLLSDDGQQRLLRVSSILTRAIEVRYQQAQSPSLSSWIERAWHSLGGPLCLDKQQRGNTRIFFAMLDEITPDGIACLGEDLDNRLSRLFAQPDPNASERAGIQLMTIHKAKGLGFDVVIVPGLDRGTGHDRQPLICMLERVSLDDPDEDELLVAPIGSKGEDTHPLYRWVRKQRDLREVEERKRIFYVACTRARRELHLLGTATVTPHGLDHGDADSLLASAWSALEGEFIAAYDALPRQGVIPFPTHRQPGVFDIAATADSGHPPLMSRRLPVDISFPPAGTNVTVPSTFSVLSQDNEPFQRPEGSRLQRTVGSIIHALLEQVSRHLAESHSLSDSEIKLRLRSQAEGMLRAAAIAPDQAATALADILAAIDTSASDPYGRWILGSHPEAQSEASWTGWIDGALRTVRADRVFRAGADPLSHGSEYFWVVDYKTSQYSGPDVARFLALQRELYEPQLAQYGRALRKLHGTALLLRFALYFPRLGRMEHWTG